jgi:uncharacterized OsmC-like protein
MPPTTTATTPASASSVRDRQAPLRRLYRERPEEALITDRAATTGEDPGDPFHGRVVPDKAVEPPWRYGIHRAVGGLHDAPTSGDILCTALATCLESTIRMIADRLGVELAELRVEATADVDVRGTLVVDPKVPVGFQRMRTSTRIRTAPGTDPELVATLTTAAEHCCIVLQTLRDGVPVDSRFDVGMTA